MILSNQYADLGSQFSRLATPEEPTQPQLLLWNKVLETELNLEISNEQKAGYFSGQQLLPGSKPIATAYSGHQFGHFNPQLGDGRAHLLGELTDKQGKTQEIQLKGSGQTPFSRNGDGKCGIKPAVREYIMSEAMHAIGVPTTRCLSITTTGEYIQRETNTPGAVVARIADSHIRVGTFEYFAARGKQAEIKVLADLTIARHYPTISQHSESKYLSLLSDVIDKQIDLVVNWMRVGFIHGVMNTDNTLLSGQTIDYGPCAMLGVYDPSTVFSSIDHNGRYAFGNQANIAQWNMTRLAECFLNLVDVNEQKAIEMVTPLLQEFPEKYNQAFNHMMARKIGFEHSSAEVNGLQQELLSLMFKHQLDYTQTFTQLMQSIYSNESNQKKELNSNLSNWQQQWVKYIDSKQYNHTQVLKLMQLNNPVVIPRNHHIEKVLEQVENELSNQGAMPFLEVIQSPYSMLKNTSKYQDLSPDNDLNYQTFCGT